MMIGTKFLFLYTFDDIMTEDTIISFFYVLLDLIFLSFFTYGTIGVSDL